MGTFISKQLKGEGGLKNNPAWDLGVFYFYRERVLGIKWKAFEISIIQNKYKIINVPFCDLQGIKNVFFRFFFNWFSFKIAEDAKRIFFTPSKKDAPALQWVIKNEGRQQSYLAKDGKVSKCT